MFEPKTIYFENDALNYDTGKRIYQYFKDKNAEIEFLKSHNRIPSKPGATPQQAYAQGKSTLVVGVRRTLNFATCKPSAHFQLPLVTSCMGKCEYCYLNTQLGSKPYVRVYVNIEEILEKVDKYISESSEEKTIFEAAATSDPIPVEPFTGLLGKTIDFFSEKNNAKLRFVTKFTDVDSLLNLKHNGNTTIRFSINADSVIKKFEHSTPALEQRLQAASKLFNAGYPLGFIIAPVFIYPGWEYEYRLMLDVIKQNIAKDTSALTFEVISHRFTTKAKNTILKTFPASEIPMNEEERVFKYGQFGYGKYVYPKEAIDTIKSFFHENIKQTFPESKILYTI